MSMSSSLLIDQMIMIADHPLPCSSDLFVLRSTNSEEMDIINSFCLTNCSSRTTNFVRTAPAPPVASGPPVPAAAQKFPNTPFMNRSSHSRKSQNVDKFLSYLRESMFFDSLVPGTQNLPQGGRVLVLTVIDRLASALRRFRNRQISTDDLDRNIRKIVHSDWEYLLKFRSRSSLRCSIPPLRRPRPEYRPVDESLPWNSDSFHWSHRHRPPRLPEEMRRLPSLRCLSVN